MSYPYLLLLPLLLLPARLHAQNPSDIAEDLIIDLYFDTLAGRGNQKHVVMDDLLRPIKDQDLYFLDLCGPRTANWHPEDADLLGSACRDSLRACRHFHLRPEVPRSRSNADTTREFDERRTFVSFSHVTFSQDGSRACFYGEMVCGGLCGSGWLIVVERVKKRWRTKWREMLWIS